MAGLLLGVSSLNWGRINDADVLVSGAMAGKGFALLFDFLVADALKSGALVPVLEDHTSPTRPIHALYPKNRHLLPKVGVFLDFLADVFKGPRRSPANNRP